MEKQKKVYIKVDRACRKIPFSMNDEHYHPYIEIYYLINGEAKYFIAGEIYNMKKGDLAIIPYGVLHRTMNTTGRYCERLNVTFDAACISDPLLMEGVAPRIIKSENFNGFPVEQILCEMEKEYVAGDRFSKFVLKSLLERLLVGVCRMGNTPRAESGVSPADRPLIDAARYINEHYGDELTLDALAKRFAMSPGHFSKKFKSTTGFGLSKYITQVRIINAEKLLLHTKLSITDVANRCGFTDPNYFAAVFKAQKGVPPYRYAKLHRTDG